MIKVGLIDGSIRPDLAGFVERARTRRVVPVARRLLADGETPVGVYQKLGGGPGTFLLESAEPAAGAAWSRYSFIGVRSLATLTERDGRAVWLGTPPADLPADGDPLTVLRDTLRLLSHHGEDAEDAGEPDALPPLSGGLVGYLGYDFVRRLERLPVLADDDLRLPELGMMIATDLVVLDHYAGAAILIANAVLPPDASEEDAAAGYHHAVGRLDAMTSALSRPTPPLVSTVWNPGTVRNPGPVTLTSRTPDGGYPKAVEAAKEAIRAGDCFQIVVAQRFEAECEADALDVYRVLRTTNPSPYMYLLRYDGFDIVGSSPEAHLKVTADRRALLHPIAGTRPRGRDAEHDAQLAAELIEDPKERSEHVMLVDLGRNDLGRVSRPGTVEVPEFAAIERYSHVMHIVSTVVAELRDEHTAFDALCATFPAGTLSGAPKVRAMEIIEELEPTRRGLYGGTVGYLGFAGDLDMAIAIRTALIRGRKAYVQAGAGIVADSDPAAEEQETRNKAMAVLSAIAAAQTLRAAR